MKYAIVSVDFQNSYLLKGQEFYCSRPGLLSGIVRHLYPLLKKYDIEIFEILSDYRAPSKEHKIGCQPGTLGFLSGLDNKFCSDNKFIKANISPLWQRINIGESDKPTDEPYYDPKPFNEWVKNNFPSPSDIKIILMGIGIESSMFATAKEFSQLGYDVYFLYEASDTIRHNKAYKRLLFQNSPLLDYIGLTSYKNLRKDLRRQGERRVIRQHKEIPQGLDFFARTNNEVSINKVPNPNINTYAKQVKEIVTADVDVPNNTTSITLSPQNSKPEIFEDVKKEEKMTPKIDYIDEYKEVTFIKPKPKLKRGKVEGVTTKVTKEGNVSVHDKYMREKEIKKIEKAFPHAPAKAKRKQDESEQ